MLSTHPRTHGHIKTCTLSNSRATSSPKTQKYTRCHDWNGLLPHPDVSIITHHHLQQPSISESAVSIAHPQIKPRQYSCEITWLASRMMGTSTGIVYLLAVNCCISHFASSLAKPHVAVIGAGFGGWGAAKALCENGCRVTLIDMLPDPTGATPYLTPTGIANVLSCNYYRQAGCRELQTAVLTLILHK